MNCKLLYFLLWNVLLFSFVQSGVIYSLNSNDIPEDPTSFAPDESETLQKSGNTNEYQNILQSQPGDDVLNAIIKQIIPQLLGSLNNANGQIESRKNPQMNLTRNTSDSNDDSDSIGITVLPVTEEIATANTNTSSVQDDAYAIHVQDQNNTATDEEVEVESIDQDHSTTDNSTSKEGYCSTSINQIVDSQPKLQLNQVTASQILYHLKMQYQDYQLDLKKGNEEDKDNTYEIIQKTFLKEMLRETSANNKNVVSTTYAAYYSTEYTYTFALCKLHHITKGSEDPHGDISSKCSKIMEIFGSFSTSYEEIISEVTFSEQGEVLKYDDDDKKNNSNSDSDNPSDSNNISNSSNTKLSKFNDETVERKMNEKDLHGYDDNNFFNRVRSEGNVLDQFDLNQRQQIGDFIYSKETKGKRSDSVGYLLSEVRDIPKDISLDDPAKGSLRLRKTSNTLRTDSEARTKGHSENNDVVINSDRLQQYNRIEKQLDQFERNYFDDDNADIGGNIKNGKLQDVESHYFATVEHIRDVNELQAKPKNHERDEKKYTFRRAVEKLRSYIRILHVFVGDMEKNVADNKNSANNREKDAYNEMHESIYQQTLSYRQYLKEYFASTNVESGTFSGNETLDTLEMEAESLQTTVKTRFLWLKNADLQTEADSKLGAPDEIKNNPIHLLWYLEEANFYSEHFKQSQINVPFLSYLPYPNFNVKALSDSANGADIQFYLN